MTTRVCSSFADVDAAAWDALVEDADNPFVEHAFLRALEDSGSIGAETAWRPRVVVVEEAGRIVAAAPAFLRTDSYGEFIFDWQIADAAKRMGLRYYPKLTVAVPYTPATGPRLLGDAAHRPALGRALVELMTAEQASSLHVLFCSESEQAALMELGAAPRASMQFHWHNRGYGNFDDFLSAMSHQERKQIKRERRRVVESGLVVDVRRGADVPPSWWPRLYALYTSIYERKWGRPYLTERFFRSIPQTLGERAVVVVAKDPARMADANDEAGIVAMTLSFERGRHCYGRYWGSAVDVPGLHFELCYYALIERAIARGQTLVEAGAQGEHKLKRGYLPTTTRSAHLFASPALHGAVARFFAEEAVAVAEESDELAAHGPYRAEP